VETQCQRDEVRSIGCDEAQGYFHARPMPASGIRAQLGALGGWHQIQRALPAF
jgi:EAL domain-containing protein (putative c-di-GMP-specific phosphodiesterase class I)